MSKDLKIIAVTGTIGSGKSTVSHLFHTLFQIPVISADELGHRVLSEDLDVQRVLIEHFGAEILDKSHSTPQIDRKRLGSKVFSDADELAFLESVVHPRISALFQKMVKEISSSSHPSEYVIYDVPLFFERVANRGLFHAVVLVSSSDEIAMLRLQKTRGMSEQEYWKRRNKQISNEMKAADADFTIENNSSEDALMEKVRDTMDSIRSKTIKRQAN